jgi:hypothetical protein
VGGGHFNKASGTAATVPGGWNNEAKGNYSFAAGFGAWATHDGAFVWRDSQVGSVTQSSAADQFLIRARGGTGIIDSTPSGALPARLTVLTGDGYSFPQFQIHQTNSGDYGRLRFGTDGTTNIWDLAAYNGAGARALNIWAGSSAGGGSDILSLKPDDATNLLVMSNGARLTTGGAWTNSSDRGVKRDFTPVDGRQLLERLAEIPIQSWSYKSEHPEVRHIGPTAQDFRAAFGMGDSDKSIATVDADGVALAAIQALHASSTEKDRRIAQLTDEVEDLRARLERLERAGNAGE